jgi:cytochrome bd-type quinol oxidase subunit 1
MLTEEEKKFVVFWEQNRDQRATLRYQLLLGLPLGVLVSLPLLVNFLFGRFWYKRADAVGSSQFNPLVLVFAVLLISVFVAVFYKKFQWERNEQRYLELTRRKDR